MTEAEEHGSQQAEDGAEDEDEAVTREDVVAQVAAYDEALAGEVGELVERLETLESELAGLETELAETESALAEAEERLEHTRADFQNYKKRAKRRQEEIKERATEDLVERLLEVRDNLDRALEEESEDVESLREGIKLTRKQFDRVLDAERVEPIDPKPGDETDPDRHEVMMRVESDQPPGTVASVYRLGYEMAGTVLRPAQVTVSDADTSDPEDEESERADENTDGSAEQAAETSDSKDPETEDAEPSSGEPDEE